MKSHKIFFISILLLLSLGCESSLRSRVDSGPAARPKTTNEGLITVSDKQSEGSKESVSLKEADQNQTVAAAMERKIIRNAELALEVAAPGDAQRKITSIAESHAGFVVTSESKLSENGDPAKHELETTLTVRIPSLQFGPALDQIRALGTRVIQEKVTGQDVSEEFIDLEARIKTQKALEAQFLEIMKQAIKVADALEVQRQIAEVRTEIEKLEGRKRFLENRASLSTITVNLRPPTAIVVNTSGFGRNIIEAVRDSIDLAGAIVLFLIRFVIVMAPIFLLVVLPGALIARVLVRRARRLQLARKLQSDPQAD